MDHERVGLALIVIGTMTPSLGPVTPLALGGRQVDDGFGLRVVRRAGDRGMTDEREAPY